MAISADMLQAMIEAGCSPEQMLAVARAGERKDEAKQARKRELNKLAQERCRARKALSASDSVIPVTPVMHDTGDSDDKHDTPPAPDKESPQTPKEINPTPAREGVLRAHEGGEFQNFWNLYPNKVGKRSAEKAFEAARKRASFETIMAGLERYVAKVDDRPWRNPATWLNDDSWADEPATVAPRGPPQARGSPAMNGYKPKRPINVAQLSRQQLAERQSDDEPPDNSVRRLEARNRDAEITGFGNIRFAPRSAG